MKTLLAECRAALLATLTLALVCCGVYPLVVYAVGQATFRHWANGSLITDGQGLVRGSELLGQVFTNAAYFHPRPSAAGGGYDAAASGGSNLGPTSRKLRDTVAERVSAYRLENGLKPIDPVPADAVTASGSGLDPDISPANAQLQIARVATARGLPPASVSALVAQTEEERQLAFLGERRVNVLRLNMALDKANTSR